MSRIYDYVEIFTAYGCGGLKILLWLKQGGENRT
jgi:hypothetical protein